MGTGPVRAGGLRLVKWLFGGRGRWRFEFGADSRQGGGVLVTQEFDEFFPDVAAEAPGGGGIGGAH